MRPHIFSRILHWINDRWPLSAVIRWSLGTLSSTFQGAGGGVARWAHIGGFATGMMLLPILRNRKLSYRKSFPDETYHYVYR